MLLTDRFCPDHGPESPVLLQMTPTHQTSDLHECFTQQRGDSNVALFWGLHCNSDACDFHAVIGWTHELPRYIRLGFCSHCFHRIHVQEICNTDDPDYIEDTRVIRVMVSAAPRKSPLAGKSPRERRIRRKELGIPPKGRFTATDSSDLFLPTGTYLFYEHGGGPVRGVKQADCPHCGQEDSITIGFDEDHPVCPKCKTGKLDAAYGAGW